MHNTKISKMRMESILILGLLGGISSVLGSSVPIRDIEYLTFHQGVLTTGRRVSPVQQLIYNGMFLKNKPESIMCKNMGWDGTDVIWKCEASLDEGLEIEKTHIICEGYDYPEDPNILAGSCSLSYSLNDTNQTSSSRFWLILLTIVIWSILFILLCGPRERSRSYYSTSYRRDDGPGFWTGAGLGYLAGSRSGSSHSRYKGGKHTSISYAKTGRK